MFLLSFFSQNIETEIFSTLFLTNKQLKKIRIKSYASIYYILLAKSLKG